MSTVSRGVSLKQLEQFTVLPNLIPPGCKTITPEMLPLVEFDAEQIAQIVQGVPGGVRNVQDIYPLTPLQEGMLFHHLLSGRTDSYIGSTVLEFQSREQLNAFIDALQRVIGRHDILRSAVFWERLPRPVQVVYRQAALPVVELDRGGDPIGQLKERMRAEQQGLDLRHAPLMRMQVMADARGVQWYALLQLHHLVFDGRTLEIVMAEVMAHLQGRAQGLAEPIPYRGHVAQALAHARTHDTEAFFRGKLAAIDEPTAPFGLLDVHGDGSRIDEARQSLDPALAGRLRAQARRLRVSAATLFHAAWALVVAHTSGRDDVVYGSVFLGRLQTREGARQKLGMFLNTLLLRLRLQEVTAKELVVRTQTELLELLNYEQSPLTVAQRCSGIDGSAPLFTALLNYRHQALNPECDWGNLPGARVLARSGSRTNYPITLAVDDFGDGFVLTAQTDRRIDPRRVTGYMYTAMWSLVEALEKAPQTPALALSILPDTERRQILESFNVTKTTYPQEKLLHQLFEDQVQHRPDAVAVVYADQRLTYSELNGRANRLARHLRKRKLGPDRLAALCVERGLDMVVGLLAILKAGGAYVPMDPSYPPERLAYILKDAAPQVLLTQERLKSALPPTGADVIALDCDWKDIAAQEEGNLDPRSMHLTSQHLAYVIYTSGSTGEPKGVAAEHRGMVNRVAAQKRLGAFRGDDICCQKTSIAFVDAIFETLGPLSNGRPLVLASDAAVKDVLELGLLIEREHITRLITVPSLARALLENGDVTRCLARLRSWTLSGEELQADLLRRLQEQFPDCAFLNLYGSSEVAADATYFESRNFDGCTVPIGRPISNTRIYILDQRLQLVPIGVVGEIYIAGTGVARGYLNRPDLTAERFIADPFDQDPQGRLYKSGDLGRWRADGTIEYRGRSDQQVKLRGFRIELGEIEAQLIRHAQVREAVVVARENASGERRLVAYITRDHTEPHCHEGPCFEDLSAHLRSVLPEYMVPSVFISLDSLPRTPSGKLDRRALQIAEFGAELRRQYQVPQGTVEETLAQIWQELLRVERVGREDNFFELGGHSLYGVRLIAAVAEQLSVRLPLTAVFQYPTIRQMGKLVELLSVISEQPRDCEVQNFSEGVI
jgi:amino acid adenylation domain-containing protein